MVEEDVNRKQHTIRVELARKEAVCRDRSTQALSPYMAQTNTYKARCSALDQTRLNTDPRVQDWASIAGTRRSLPTNVPDGTTVSVNRLKFKRDTDFISTNPYDGGPSYNDQVCVNNWTEEQHDRNFKTGFHPKPLRKGGRFSTEYMQRYSPTSEEYRQRLKDTYNTTQRFEGLNRITINAVAAPVRPQRAADNSGQHVFYAKDGYGVASHQDHTHAARRGNFWVGTVAPTPYDSVTHSTMRQEPMEFQRRCPMEDARSKILLGNKSLIEESPRTLRIREELIATNAFSRTWQSTYMADMRDFSRRPNTVA